MTPHPPHIFDRVLYRRRRARAARNFSNSDFLHQRAMADIVDRLETVTRDFPKALFYGVGGLTTMITPACGIGGVINADLSLARLPADNKSLVFDEELLPLVNQSVDLIVSVLTLHTANDPIGALSQMRMALKPDGLLIAVLFGENTLSSLRGALYQAETEITGGVSPRISPFASVRDLGGALQRAGLALPVADVDLVKVSYQNPMRLLADIRTMGETSVLRAGSRALRRDVLTKTMKIFAETGGEETFELVYLTGWAPDASQQQALKPGSASHSLEKAIKP